MRIVAVLDKLAAALVDRSHVLGGAERTAIAHLRCLAKTFGHVCHIVTPAPVRREARVGGLHLSSYRDLEELKESLTRLQPQAVFANLDLVYDTANLTRTMGIPYFALLDSFECCEPSASEKKLWRVSLTRKYLDEERAVFALKTAAHRLACSDYLARRVSRQCGVRVDTVYPPFDPREMMLSRLAIGQGAFITGICGHSHKGAEIFLELCRRFRGERFLLAGSVSPGLRPQLARHPNLALAPSLQTVELLERSRIVLVPSQWEEPFGRIAVEAMANGIAVLASRTGGLKEIVGRSALGVKDFREVRAWADALRPLVRSAAARAANGARGRQLARPFVAANSTATLDRLVRRVTRTGMQKSPRGDRSALRTSAPSPAAFSAAGEGRGGGRPGTKLRVATAPLIEPPDQPRRLGSQDDNHSDVRRDRRQSRKTIAILGSLSEKTAFSIINARLAAELGRTGALRVIQGSDSEATGIGVVDAFVQHDYASEFTGLTPPAQGRWVVVRPWDFGPYPPAWAAKIGAEVDRLWVASRWSKALALRGGIPANRVAVIPWGVDEKIFKPNGARYPLPTRKRFIFLFVGAPVHRKGLDILLNAYGAAFSRRDDVCLMLKIHRADVFYAGIGMHQRVRELQTRRDHPEILLIDDFLPETQLASLYRACDVGVFPYRAEGFALPILEAMACGLPSIVPNFGACLDYCSRASSFPVRVKRISLPVRGEFQLNTLGFTERINEVDFCEVPVENLAHEMRRVTKLPAAQLRRLAAAGVRISHGRFKWSDTARRALRDLDALLRRRVPVRLATARALRAAEDRRRAVAAELLRPKGKSAHGAD